jgi:hypothetical protein
MPSLSTPLSGNLTIHESHPNRQYSAPVRKAVIVLGMHRSGTSALTRVLGLSGAALPSQSPFDSHESNPLGHWEPRRIVETHDRFLADSGVGWDDIFDYPDAIFGSRAAESCRDRLTAIAAREYGRADMFVLKDPRLSRLMPLWRPVLDRLGAVPRVVIAVRNPLEVAASLLRRDGWNEYRALTVWMRYMLAAERDTRDMPRCFVRQDRLLSDWRPLIRSISDRLDLSLAVDDEAVGRKVDDFIRDDLVHHRRSDAELFDRADIPDCIKQVYRQCWSAANGDGINIQAFDAVGQALDDATQSYRQTGSLELLRDRSPNVVNIRGKQSRRDALFALSVAELGRARDQERRARRELELVLNTRSWRFTRPLRAAAYLIKRSARVVADGLFNASTRLKAGVTYGVRRAGRAAPDSA